MRLDPLTGVWTLFSSARAGRPFFDSASAEGAPDPFVAGCEMHAPHALHQMPEDEGWRVRVVPNRAPVLRVEGDASRRGDGIYDRMDGVGAHEVIVEDAGSRALCELSRSEIEQVISAWKTRMLDLMRDPRMRSFSIVKNVGRAAGARVDHSVSQLIAMAVIPPLLRRKLEAARDFYDRKKRSIFDDILAEEVRAGTRLVYENNGFAVFCPYASRAPFELAIYPKRQCSDFHGISDQECAQFADALGTALRKLVRALDGPAYHLMLFTAPTRTDRRDHWTTIERDFRWHVEILPRLEPVSALELGTGCWVNGVWPEVAAEFLCALEVAE